MTVNPSPEKEKNPPLREEKLMVPLVMASPSARASRAKRKTTKRRSSEDNPVNRRIDLDPFDMETEAPV
jgi:hypothetical protein